MSGLKPKDGRLRTRTESEEDVRSIVHLYVEYRKSFRDISARVGLSRPAVREILVEHGVQIRQVAKNGSSARAVPGDSKTKHQVGDRYDRLTISGFGHVDKGRRKTLVAFCKCDCGATKVVRLEHLAENRTNSCGCQPRGNWRGAGELSYSYYAELRRGAEKRRLSFSTSIESLWALFQDQQARCAISGLPLVMGFGVRSAGTSSVDRIDSSKGYEDGNVQWVHVAINWMKMDLPENTFKERCAMVAHHTGVAWDTPTVSAMYEPRKCRAGRCYMEKHMVTKRGKYKAFVGDIPQRFFNRIRDGAVSRGLCLDVTIEEIWALFQQQGGLCALSGVPLTIGDVASQRTASLDRKDSKIGYTLDNLQWVHQMFNRMKMDLSNDYFKGLCALVALSYNPCAAPDAAFSRASV